MTEAETAVREALAKMTPGDLEIERCTRADYHLMDADGACMATVYLYDDDDQARANAAGIVALRNHTPTLLAELDAARAEVERLREALGRSDAAMREYYRYWTGGETRGSYDGKPERAALWDAMWKNRLALEASHDPR